MFGARSQYEFANLLVVNLRRRLHYAYLQDDFKVSQRLTLNLGVRYEFATPYYEDAEPAVELRPGDQFDHPGERRFAL